MYDLLWLNLPQVDGVGLSYATPFEIHTPPGDLL